MSRTLARRLVPLACTLALVTPATARAGGAWTTWIRMQTCNDVIAGRDTVWIASGEAGLIRYVRSAGEYTAFTREPGALANNSLEVLAFDGTGRLWAGTAGSGASRLTAQGAWDLVNAFDGLPSDTVTALRAEGDTMWVGTSQGIALWDGRQIAGSVPDVGSPSPFGSNNVTGIIVLRDTLLVATSLGVYESRISQGLVNWNEMDSGMGSLDVASLASDGQSVFALADGVIYRFVESAGNWVSASPATPVIRMRDDFGTIMAINVNGLSLWNGSSWSGVPGSWGSDGTAADLVEPAADPTGHFFEVRRGLLYEQAGPPWRSTTPPGVTGDDVQNVLADGNGVWVDTYDAGVSHFDGATWHNYPTGCCGPAQDTTFMDPSFAFALQRDLAGRIWISNWETGIERIDLSGPVPVFDHVCNVYGIPQADTLDRHSDGWSSAVDAFGYVYIGGDTPSLGGGANFEPMGIDVYDTIGTRVINWKTTNAGLASNQTRALSVDKYGTLWAGFAGSGVGYADITTMASDSADANVNDHRRLPQFQAVAGLETSDIFGVVAHGDSVWVLTTSDLEHVSAPSRIVGSHLDIPAGPPPRGAVHLLDVSPDGTVWVGSVSGVRAYQPGGATQDFTTDNSPLADDEVRAVSVDPRTGVVWFGTASGVNRYDPHYQPPPPPSISRLQARVYPNPTHLSGIGLSLKLTGNTSGYSGEIIDLGGRVVRRFADATNGGAIWDGRDGRGNLVRPGVYFVHARAGGHEATVRVVVLR
ncbi:MAG TPA: hypothetical protein VMH61_08580 [Candidatus Acidoferrales bacterium]|nr:hypothetical protein [Candidatus Acidoferrales bacterium]